MPHLIDQYSDLIINGKNIGKLLIYFQFTQHFSLLDEFYSSIVINNNKFFKDELVLNNNIDIIATDHAPHSWDEKQNKYFNAPSGGPLVQHALPAMLEHVKNRDISIERVVEKMCHAPAECFNLNDRGYVREGYFADLVLIDQDNPWTVSKDNILYKCGWSIFEGSSFSSRISHTFVNGRLAYKNGSLIEGQVGQRVTFQR